MVAGGNPLGGASPSDAATSCKQPLLREPSTAPQALGAFNDNAFKQLDPAAHGSAPRPPVRSRGSPDQRPGRGRHRRQPPRACPPITLRPAVRRPRAWSRAPSPTRYSKSAHHQGRPTSSRSLVMGLGLLAAYLRESYLGLLLVRGRLHGRPRARSSAPVEVRRRSRSSLGRARASRARNALIQTSTTTVAVLGRASASWPASGSRTTSSGQPSGSPASSYVADRAPAGSMASLAHPAPRARAGARARRLPWNLPAELQSATGDRHRRPPDRSIRLDQRAAPSIYLVAAHPRARRQRVRPHRARPRERRRPPGSTRCPSASGIAVGAVVAGQLSPAPRSRAGLVPLGLFGLTGAALLAGAARSRPTV